mgnify:CR=1 FL=1
MRHLMSPLDFTVEELDNLMDLARTSKRTLRNMLMHVMERN